MCVSLWVSVLVGVLVLLGIAAYSPPSTASHRERSTTHPSVCCRYYCIAYERVYMIPRTLRSYGTYISSYPSVSRYMSSCEVHYNIPVQRHTCLLYCRYCRAGDETRYMILHTL